MQSSKSNVVYLILITSVFLFQCNRQKRDIVNQNQAAEPVYFPFFLSEKTMIVNEEQNNEAEGHYLKVLEVISDSSYRINLPRRFYPVQAKGAWMLGWPTGNAYYDAGNENLREVRQIDTVTGIVTLGKILRGSGKPQLDQRVVFWNSNPSGFRNWPKGKVVKPEDWKNFAGSSIEFGAVIFDSLNKQWIMYTQEVDTTRVQIYAAISSDLRQWTPANQGKPIFTAEHFAGTSWAGLAEDGKTPQTARMYSAIYDNGRYFFFLSGYGKDGKRAIGLITATNPVTGPFIVTPKALIIPEGKGCDERGCFYPKVCKMGNSFIMYYDGIAADGTESVCMAESNNLMKWTKWKLNPVISSHYGWRSGMYTSEPNYVECRGDSVWLMVGGYKKYNTEFTRDDSLLNKLPLDAPTFSVAPQEKGRHISGNVMDAVHGVYLSLDKGRTFRPHSNNPVWINNYSDSLQNDHLGGDFFYCGDIILYQAKSETEKRYNILLRERSKP